jgi:hypothetical protein
MLNWAQRAWLAYAYFINQSATNSIVARRMLALQVRAKTAFGQKARGFHSAYFRR